MISVPHSELKTGFKNSKWRQCANIKIHEVILSCDSREGVVFMTWNIGYCTREWRHCLLFFFGGLWPFYYFLHISNRQEHLGERERNNTIKFTGLDFNLDQRCEPSSTSQPRTSWIYFPTKHKCGNLQV